MNSQRVLFFSGVCFLGLVCSVFAQKGDATKSLGVLKESSNRDDLLRAGLTVIGSKDQSAISELVKLLKDSGFLARIDSEKDYLDSKARAVYLVRKIAVLPATQGEEALLDLEKDKVFTDNEYRLSEIIDASALVDKPSGKVVEMLRRRADSSANTIMAVRSLCRIHTSEACDALQKLVLDPKLDSFGKEAWFTHFLIFVRYDPAVVKLYQSLTDSKIARAELREAIVASLFDYRPEVWYRDLERPKVPQFMDASTDVLKVLLQITESAGKLELEPRTKTAVLKARKEIEVLLKERQKKS